MELLQSWWEIPAIAHFFSLFKSCFSLSDFTIEELEDSLLTDEADEKSTYFISRLLSELLQGYYGNCNITVTTCHDWLRKIMKERWEDIEGRINPLSSAEADFHQLPLRLKVQIIHRITEYRLDAKDVEIKLQGLNATDLRLEPLGCDHSGARYWYFFGVRLYKEYSQNGDDKELETKNEKKRKKKKKKKVKKNKNILNLDGKSKWSVACYSVNDWKKLAANMKGTESRREKALMLLITENFLPNLPKIVDDMERQRLAKLQSEPRRSSCRLLARKLCLAEQEAEKKCALEREEEVKREREEMINSRSFNVTQRIQSDFEKMLRLELERKWKEDADRRMQEIQDRIQDADIMITSSDDEDIELEVSKPLMSVTKRTSKQHHEEQEITNNTMLGKRKMKNEMKNTKKPKLVKKNAKKSKKPEVEKLKQEIEEGWSNKEVSKTWKRKSSEETWRKTSQRGISNDKDSDEDDEDESDHEIEQVGMKKVIDDLHVHPESWQFDSPVDEEIAPGYHSIIKRPMDLSEIERKLGSGEYEMSKGFISDVFLMFNNCRLYNGPESEYTEVTDELDELFRRLMKKHLPHVKIEDELNNHHFSEPVRKTRRSSEMNVEESLQKEEGEEEDNEIGNEFKGGATTRAAWKEKVEAKPPEQTDEEKINTNGKQEIKKRGSRGRGRGRPSTRGGGRGRGRGQGSRGRGQRFSRRTSVQRERKISERQQRETSEESDTQETLETDVVDKVVEEKDEQEVREEKIESNDQAEGEISKISESENNKSHRSSSSSSRNSSVERDRKKEEVTESKTQNIWSLDFLASQARVLEEQQQQQRPTAAGAVQQKRDDHWNTTEDKQQDEVEANESYDETIESDKRKKQDNCHQSDEEEDDDEDVYNFKDDEDVPESRFNKHGGRESVISSTGLTASPPAAYPMTPGNPENHRFQSPSKPPSHELRPSPHDSRPSMKHRSIDSSPPTPSSGYGSYKTSDMGRSITPNESSVPSFNPATPKIDLSPERESDLIPLQRLSSNPLMKKSSEPPSTPPGPPSSSSNLPQESPTIPSNAAAPHQLKATQPTNDNVADEKVKENLPKTQRERSLPSEKSPLARSRLPSSNLQQNQTSTVDTSIQHHQQQTMHERPPARPPHQPPPSTQPASKPTPPARSIQQTSPASTRAPPSTRTPLPSMRTTSRNSPRTTYPEYAGINAASRYSHSNDGRSFERSLLYAAHHQSATTNNPNLTGTQQQQNKNHLLLQSPTMASLGLNHWSLSSGNSEPRPDQRHDIRMQHDARQHHGTTNEPRSHNEHRKSSVQGPSFDKSRGSVGSSSSSLAQQETTRTKPRSKQPIIPSTASVVAARSSGRHSVAPYAPAEYQLGYHFPTHHTPSPHDFSSQQNGLLSAATNSSLLHSDLTASARLRVLQQQQQQHKPELQTHPAAGHASMFLQAGHYAGTPSQADQYNRLAATAAAQQHQFEMYHQTTNAQNPWLPQIHPSHMDPVYQHFMQGQYPMYHNILHKY